MPSVCRDDPYLAMNFLVAISGVSDEPGTVRAGFAEVSGLGVEIEPVEYRNGNEELTVRKIPGLVKYTNITLKRGIIGGQALWEWIQSAIDGKVVRADVSITLLNEAREPVMRWRAKRAWPCKWEGPDLDASRNEVAIETLELCHEGIELDR